MWYKIKLIDFRDASQSSARILSRYIVKAYQKTNLDSAPQREQTAHNYDDDFQEVLDVVRITVNLRCQCRPVKTIWKVSQM